MTNNIKKLLTRSSNFLKRMLNKPAWDFSRFLTDPRHERGRRWKLNTLMDALFLGLLVNRSSLRGVESMTGLCGNSIGKHFARRVPDSTLYELVGKLDPSELRLQLHSQVYTLCRSKSLDPVELPCGVAAVDNKTIWTGNADEAPDPDCQQVHPKERPSHSQLRVVRTVLISADSKPAIDQVVIPKQTNEGGIFSLLFQTLEDQFSPLIEIYSLDAGFCSLANANLVHNAKKG